MPIDVTPVLFMADGTEYALPAVHLLASGISVVDVKAALASAPPVVANHLSGYGSVTLKYNGSESALMAQTALGSTALSESFLSRFTSVMPGSPATQTLEGLWWTRDAGIGGFVALSNAATQPRNVLVQVISATGQPLATQSFNLVPHAGRMLDLAALIGRGINPGEAGGIRIQFNGLLGEINVTGGLENRKEGYSAVIPFWEAPMTVMNMPTSTVTIAHPGVMVGAPDSAMGFPAGTRFTPYLALRNLTSGAEQVDLKFYTEQGAALIAPVQSLEAFESRQVDLISILRNLGLKDFNGTLTFAVSHAGGSNDVMSVAGSVDAKGTYVFEVDGRAAEEKLSKQSPYWSVKNGNDTMVSLWNPSANAEDIMVTLKYAGNLGNYHFRVHLAPYATSNLDVKELIANQSRDDHGTILPLDLQEGSFVFHNAKDVHAPLSLNVNVGIFNVVKGTCYYGSVYCDGYSGTLIVSPASSSISAGGSWVEALSAYGHYSDGSTPNVWASWSSSNTAIATVDSSGNVTGGAAGNVSIKASANLPASGTYYGYNPSCSSLQSYNNFTGTATVSVGDNTPVINEIYPSDWTSGTTTAVVLQGQSFGTDAPTLSFSPSSGISYSLQAYNDVYIKANISVAAGTPNENVTLTVTSSGYGGQGFLGNGNGQSSHGTATAAVHAPMNTPEITVVAWLDSNTISIPGGASALLTSDLHNPVLCAIDVFQWSQANPYHLSNSADRGYAAAYLLKNSGNSPPPPTIDPSSFGNNLLSFRLMNDFGGANRGPVAVGKTPNPCASGVLRNWTSVAPQTNSNSGKTGISQANQVYQIAEGRLGTMGQAVNQTLLGHSTPWIWSVIEFNSAGAPYYLNHSIFPSFVFYTNGNQTFSSSPTAAQVATFIGSDNAYQVSLPINP